jgi:DNA topoisomerase-3
LLSISSHTEEAVKEGIAKAKPITDYDSLSLAAYNRAKEDWLFGMNFSRLYTCKYGYNLSKFLGLEKKSTPIAIGRVMTCVLGLVVERELEIRDFVPKKHYSISVNFKSENSQVDYIGKWQPKKTSPKTELDEEDKYITKKEAQDVMDSLSGKSGTIKKVQIKTTKENPPLLFNLAELQSEANKKFKYSVDKTLEIAQSLYEKKFITYPRTDARVISTDVVTEIPKTLNGLFKNSSFKDIIAKIKSFGPLKVTKTTKRYVDNSKITDHYAIIPTYVTSELQKLDEYSRNIYLLIVKRFLAIFFPAAEYNTVKVETQIAKEVFTTHSKTLKDAGWKEIYDISAKKDKDLSNSPLYKLEKKETSSVVDMQLDEKETKPPSRYTDGSLVITMEKAGKFIENEELREKIKTTGIGTSATRAGIIKKLKDIQYISINTKTQVVTPTKKGESIVKIVRATAKDLLKPELTASWEKGLIMLENNETTDEIFLEKLNTYINKIITKVKKHNTTFN